MISRRDGARGAQDARDGGAARRHGAAARRSSAIALPARPAPRTSRNGSYAADKYLSSFVGFAPVGAAAGGRGDDRRAVRGQHYGGAVAAPVFSQVIRARCACSACPPTHPLTKNPAAGRRRDPRGKRRDVDASTILVACPRRAAMIERLTSDSRRHAGRRVSPRIRRASHDGRASFPTPCNAAPAPCCGRPKGSAGAAMATPNRPVATLKQRLGPIAHEIYGRPSQSLWMVGVTGTNGKTSCTHWIAHARAASAPRHRSARWARAFPARWSACRQHHAGCRRAAGTLATPGQGARPSRWKSPRSASSRVGQRHRDSMSRCSSISSHDHLDYHGTMAATARRRRSSSTCRARSRGGQLRRRLRQGARQRLRRPRATIGYSLSRARDHADRSDDRRGNGASPIRRPGDAASLKRR